jgi:4-hydroxy-tetrahydrodipicolinate synthase
MLSGSLVAIATPMQSGGALDLPGLCKLIEFHIANGTAGIVIVGTTGESPTVTFDEHCLLIKSAVEYVKGRIPVIAGTGSNSTEEAIEQTEYAKSVGASYGLSVVPYYNKPSQEGLYRHFKAIAEAVDLPLLLYNVPGRTVSDLATDTVLRLAELPGVAGIKDATSDMVRHVELMGRLPKSKSFALLSGNDDTALAYMLLGGHGVISVTANVAPRAMAEMADAALKGRLKEARSANAKLMPLHTKLFVEANPIPVKWALAEMGLIDGALRLPLTPLGESHHDIVRAALREAGCLETFAEKIECRA